VSRVWVSFHLAEMVIGHKLKAQTKQYIMTNPWHDDDDDELLEACKIDKIAKQDREAMVRFLTMYTKELKNHFWPGTDEVDGRIEMLQYFNQKVT